jgi:hypothetical protein
MSFYLQLDYNPSAPGPASVTLPYNNNAASCTAKRLEPNGVKTLSLETLFYIDSNSPIRPVCFSVTAGPAGVRFEDFIISAEISNTSVTISGYVDISTYLILPTGFLPINFTRTNSLSGQLFQAVQITSNPSSFSNPITLTLPQATLYAAQYIKNLQTISVLRYEEASGQLSHITPTSWTQDSLINPLAMTVTLPSDGYYIFGYMDMTKGYLVPVASNLWVNYMTEYGKLAMQVDSKPFVLEVLASKPTRFAVMKPYQLTWDPDGFEILDKFYLTEEYPVDKSIVINMTLKYIYDGISPLYWGYVKISIFVR